ncbi:MAG: site-specific DNA-methyltransferase [Candidatus Cloacimonetes bacterium]|nr:site-specific DNA-methyltransferase [Candidatus Cloacimonadota bacterium]
MEQAKLKQFILKVLKADERLWNEDKTELNQTLLLDLIEKIDEKVIDLLLQEKDLREKFFVKIKDVFVFKTNDFRFFMEENKVDNSYTAYKNRIGLTDGKKFLKDTNDVVLDFPYKDCVLEGGQSTEEGTDTFFEYSEKAEQYEQKQGKRKEIFFNSVLAHDEIDRLFDAKALTNWKRFTKDGEQEVKEIKRDEDGTIKENLIIKGNNLLALHSLKKQFTGKIKLIYIDPPYNTRTDANTFAYNNTFNHSSWLTFMRNRLLITKDLLSENGIIFIDIDHYELFYLGVIADEIFGYDNRLGVLAVVHNLKGRYNEFFSPAHENKIVYAKNHLVAKIKDYSHDNSKDYPLEDEISKYKIVGLQRTGDGSKREDRPNLYYPIYFNKETKEISLTKKSGLIEILPIDNKGVERRWRWGKDKVKKDWKTEIIVKENNGSYKIYTKIRIKGEKPKSIWMKPEYSGTTGTNDLKFALGNKVFSYPKSVELVKDSIQISTDENDIVLDFFGGSGTTAHAVLRLNKEDGGNRKFIMIEQMDYINTVTYPRVQKVMEKENIDDSFIYFELAKWNETAKEKILACESLEELIKFFDEMSDRYFLNYNLKIKEFREKVIKEEEFKNLSLEEQKKMFIAMLDNNQMYVNKTEMADKKFGIDKEDQTLTSQFYNSEK